MGGGVDPDPGVFHGAAEARPTAFEAGTGDPQHDLAAWGNLMALPSRLDSTCCRRRASPSRKAGHLGRDRDGESQSLGRGDVGEQGAQGAAQGVAVEGRGLQVQTPRLDLGVIEDVVEDPQQGGRGLVYPVQVLPRRGRQGLKQRQLGQTMMPFMGVRISWLMWARNSDLLRAACSLARPPALDR